jgi:hypothetical protein
MRVADMGRAAGARAHRFKRPAHLRCVSLAFVRCAEYLDLGLSQCEKKNPQKNWFQDDRTHGTWKVGTAYVLVGVKVCVRDADAYSVT